MKVTVITSAYNQEAFIQDCIDSVIAQRGDFDLEHLIIDDVSSDRTPEIILAAAHKHKHIKAIIRTINRNNLNYAWPHVLDSDYVAILDGDDLWIDNDKLQKQIDYMDEHPEVLVSGTNAYLFQNEKNLLFPEYFWGNAAQLSFETLALGFGMTASTMLLSKLLITKLHDINHTTPLFDYFICLFASLNGKVARLSDYTTIKRGHANNAWGDKSLELKQNLNFVFYDKFFPLISDESQIAHMSSVIRYKRISIEYYNKGFMSGQDYLNLVSELFGATSSYNDPRVKLQRLRTMIMVKDLSGAKVLLQEFERDNLLHPRLILLCYRLCTIEGDKAFFVGQFNKYRTMYLEHRSVPSVTLKMLIKFKLYKKALKYVDLISNDKKELLSSQLVVLLHRLIRVNHKLYHEDLIDQYVSYLNDIQVSIMRLSESLKREDMGQSEILMAKIDGSTIEDKTLLHIYSQLKSDLTSMVAESLVSD